MEKRAGLATAGGSATSGGSPSSGGSGLSGAALATTVRSFLPLPCACRPLTLDLRLTLLPCLSHRTVLEPKDGDLPLDLIFLPAVAFSPSPSSPPTVDRLGHGKGYYDTFLRRYSELCAARAVEPPTLGACLLTAPLAKRRWRRR